MNIAKIKSEKIVRILNLLITVLLVTYLFGCNQQDKLSDRTIDKKDQQVSFEDSLTMRVMQNKRFAIDKTTSYKTLFLRVYHDQKENKRYLTYQNGDKNCIQFYGFDSEILEKEICFPKQGPNSVRKLAGYKVVNFDSIYVIDKSSKTLALFDRDGMRTQNYRLLHGEETNKTSMAFALTQTSFLLIEKDTMYLPAFPDRPPFHLGYPFVAVNLATGNYDYVGKFTEYYANTDENWEQAFVAISKFTYCYNPRLRKFIFSYPADPYIYAGHPRDPLGEKYLASSEKFFGMTMPDRSIKFSEEFYIATNYYRNICYDPYRNLYYRMACHRTDLVNDDMTKSKIEDKPISIIVLNANFEKVGEVFLPPNRYFYRTMFVEKEGLYISTANYTNSDLNEDYIEFDVFEPVAIPDNG